MKKRVSGPVAGPSLTVIWDAGRDLSYLREREWLVTNGLGGYASGTLLGVNTRRYHGLFIPNLPAPRGRTVMIPRLDEEITLDGREITLGGAEYADGRAIGHGHLILKEFRLDWRTPVWLYDLAGRLLEKRIVMPYGQNTVYVEYRLLNGRPMRMNLRPFVTFRAHDAALGCPPDWPFSLTASRGKYEIHPFDGAPALRLALRPDRGAFVTQQQVQSKIFYRLERDRGYDYLEELLSPGYFNVELMPGEAVALVASIEPYELLDLDAAAVFDAEHSRLRKMLSLAPQSAQQGLPAQLVLAADHFITLPGSRLDECIKARAAGEEVRTVMAGYPWFTDWGRDTMVALEGLALCTGRYREARAILQTYARYFKDGLLPNLFPEGKREPMYNSADATFWFFHAVDRYCQVTSDRQVIPVLYPALRAALRHHVKGTQFGIGLDPDDGLMKAGAEGTQLTWMDAKIDGQIITPRRGKPVEIQALWYNALRLMATWSDELNEPGDEYRQLANQAFESFNGRFWYDEGRHLYDVVDGEAGDDPTFRPNQIFSMSLRFPILAEVHWKLVVDAVTERLFTPVGLRSLDPGHRDYHPRYQGDEWARDFAYHQGIVWAWLVGHYLDACRRVSHDTSRIRELLHSYQDHLLDAGIGQVSEIFDGEPPHLARGCIAQAWSVAEILRALLLVSESDT